MATTICSILQVQSAFFARARLAAIWPRLSFMSGGFELLKDGRKTRLVFNSYLSRYITTDTVGGLSPDLLAPSTNLPPKVPGKPRGHLEVKFPYLLWDCSTPPPSPRVNLLCKWWGETSSGTIFK